MIVIDEVAIDCTSADGTDNDSDIFTDNFDYNSEELEVLVQERKRIIDCNLCDYKDIHSVKILKGEHKCDDPCGNYKVSATTVAFYFKEKLQANLKYKIKKMRVDPKNAFNINAHFEKCKRAKRTILKNMEDSFCDDYISLLDHGLTYGPSWWTVVGYQRLDFGGFKPQTLTIDRSLTYGPWLFALRLWLGKPNHRPHLRSVVLSMGRGWPAWYGTCNFGKLLFWPSLNTGCYNISPLGSFVLE
ncbi:hypothetical protein MTR67_023942 [Solanum verrucosum]|uniref:Uncharacterized protein n=1 Tax=Solanum verrucosum TaxID=315347 RepID=A0AAF0QXV7_SOLVR|nr:hypothetical protein MTR67_023942 [Solanum verrucosum]